jgi:hypothetical protein
MKVGKMVQEQHQQNLNPNQKKKILIHGITLAIRVELLKRFKPVAIC